MSSEGNLHTPGDGLFGTHVTWEDLEKEMQTVLHTSATFGPNKSVQNIGDGNGFASRICLVEPDWQNAAPGDVLPEKFIAKICTMIALLALTKKIAEEKGVESFFNLDSVQGLDEQMKKCHNMEVHIYHLLNKYKVDNVPRAKIYSARKFSDENPLKGFMIMEYMDNLSLVHVFSTLKPEEVHQALRAIAAFEALTFKITDEEKEGFYTKPLTELFGMMFNKESIVSVAQFLDKYEGKKYTREIEELTQILPDLIETEWFDAIPDQLGMTKVLCHGDLWSTNMLWRKNNDGEQIIAAVIDFQTAHLGNPAGDLSRFLSTNLSAEDRTNHTEELLETFYNFLLEEMGSVPAPYTLEQLKEAYRRYLPVSGFMIVPMFGSFADLFLEKIPEGERAHAKEVLEEKLGSLAKELLEMHKRNKTLREIE